MTLPNPRAQMIFTAFRLVASNRLSGNFYQFGMSDGYAMAAAFGCAHSDAIRTLRTVENPDTPGTGFEKMEFWGFGLQADEKALNVALSTGLKPEDIKMVMGPLVPRDMPTKSAAVVYVSLDNVEDVYMALALAEETLQVGTIVVIDKWWKAHRQARIGFERWASRYVPLQDFDNYLEVYQDNGWERSFIVKKLTDRP